MKRQATMFAAAASLALVSGAGAAQAADVAFRYSHYELNSTAGIEQVYQRIVNRAERACVTPGRRAIAQMKAEKECVTELTNDLVRLIDDPKLAARHIGSGLRFAGKSPR